MKKRTTQEWHTLFAAHDESGASAAAFCREHDLCPKYFSLRRRQLGEGSGSASTAKTAFIPVSMTTSANGVMIEIKLDGGLQLHVPLAVSPQWLGALLQQLQA